MVEDLWALVFGESYEVCCMCIMCYIDGGFVAIYIGLMSNHMTKHTKNLNQMPITAGEEGKD